MSIGFRENLRSWRHPVGVGAVVKPGKIEVKNNNNIEVAIIAFSVGVIVGRILSSLDSFRSQNRGSHHPPQDPFPGAAGFSSNDSQRSLSPSSHTEGLKMQQAVDQMVENTRLIAVPRSILLDANGDSVTSARSSPLSDVSTNAACSREVVREFGGIPDDFSEMSSMGSDYVQVNPSDLGSNQSSRTSRISKTPSPQGFV